MFFYKRFYYPTSDKLYITFIWQFATVSMQIIRTVDVKHEGKDE